MKIVVIREEKNPPDSRVPLTPKQVKSLIDKGYQIEVQRSSGRCFPDSAYENAGVPMIDNITDEHEILLGVKEVPVENIREGKTYFMFSHTIKEQPYNAKLIRKIIDQGSTLIDYEVLTNEKGQRVIAFGKFAGMVGAHNAIYTYGQRTGEIDLPRMKDIDDYAAAKLLYKKLEIPPVRIVLTGAGRVSNGSAKVLDDMGIRKVSPLDFITENYDEAVYTQLPIAYYVQRKDGRTIDFVQDFFENPTEYESIFHHFYPHADIMINGIYWDPEAPAFFSQEDMKKDEFAIQVIADVTCDIAPEASIPSTLKAATIADPIFGYDPQTKAECPAHTDGCIDMMTIDNLPNELPKDASQAFGEMFIAEVLDGLQGGDASVIERGTIVKNGKLTERFNYLKNYAGL